MSHTDLSSVPVAVAPSPVTSGTTFGVSDANAAKLPTKFPWWGAFKPSNAVPTRSNAEIVKVKSSSSSAGITTYTIQRSQGNPVTTARSVQVGDDFYEANASQTIMDIESGWVELPEVFTYASADDPVFVMNTSVDLTSILSVGMKIKLTQTTVKYFIIVAISSSTVTIYGGTDYDLVSAAITGIYFSTVRIPLGFPMSPAKWTVEATSSSDLSQASPTGSTWYNLGLTISLPIGAWDVKYFATLLVDYSTTVTAILKATLGTSSSAETDSGFTATGCLIGVTDQIAFDFTRSGIIVLASKTTYYLLGYQSGQSPATTILFWGTQNKIIIRAVCAYL